MGNPSDNPGKSATVEWGIILMSYKIKELGERIGDYNRFYTWNKDTKQKILRDIKELQSLIKEIKILTLTE